MPVVKLVNFFWLRGLHNCQFIVSRRNWHQLPGLGLLFQCPLFKVGESVSISVGAQRRLSHFWESRQFSWAEWHRLALWFNFCCGHIDIHDWAEPKATRERPVCAWTLHKYQNLQNQAHLILEANVIHSFPHIGDTERGPLTWAKIQEITGWSAGRILLSVLSFGKNSK